MQENIYCSRIDSLRKLMINRGIDAYVVLTDDFHASEYVGDYFKCRAYLSGFTGSAGTLVVTADEAGLWTDGRQPSSCRAVASPCTKWAWTPLSPPI